LERNITNVRRRQHSASKPPFRKQLRGSCRRDPQNQTPKHRHRPLARFSRTPLADLRDTAYTPASARAVASSRFRVRPPDSSSFVFAQILRPLSYWAPFSCRQLSLWPGDQASKDGLREGDLFRVRVHLSTGLTSEGTHSHAPRDTPPTGARPFTRVMPSFHLYSFSSPPPPSPLSFIRVPSSPIPPWNVVVFYATPDAAATPRESCRTS